MADSAALMFGGAATLSLLEAAIPGGPRIALVPGIGAFAFALVVSLTGTRLPRGALAALGPIAAALIALTLASGAGARDASVLYVLPVLWESYFFGRRGTVLIVIWIGLIQALSLIGMPGGAEDVDRWLDGFVSGAVVGAVVELLSSRNRGLVKRLEGEARLDELTGLLNRRGFFERAEIELGGSRRERSSVGVASFDLDHFKRINDECGHGAGDRVLVRMADIFRAEMRDTDLLARMGGEEFVALLPGGEIADAQRFAERARSSLAVVGGNGVPSVTVSAGVTAAVAPSDLESILNRADRALYEAKLRGRDQIVAY